MIVVDASAIVDALLSAADMKRLINFPGVEDWHAAPNFIDVEVLSAFRRLEFGRHVTVKRSREAISDFRQFNILRFDATELILDIWPHPHGLRRGVCCTCEDAGRSNRNAR